MINSHLSYASINLTGRTNAVYNSEYTPRCDSSTGWLVCRQTPPVVPLGTGV